MHVQGNTYLKNFGLYLINPNVLDLTSYNLLSHIESRTNSIFQYDPDKNT